MIYAKYLGIPTNTYRLEEGSTLYREQAEWAQLGRWHRGTKSRARSESGWWAMPDTVAGVATRRGSRWSAATL